MSGVNMRKNRGNTQKIYLIETKNISTFSRQYIIMGSTGNIYKIIIDTKPSCTCPDFMTRNVRCKHIYFVLSRVMKLEDVDQKEFKEQELLLMFQNIPLIAKTLCVNDDIKSKYYKVVNDENSDSKDIKGLDDICPICLDDVDDGHKIDSCKKCKRSVHDLCFKMWCKINKKECMFCKSNWNSMTNNGYINLLS